VTTSTADACRAIALRARDARLRLAETTPADRTALIRAIAASIRATAPEILRASAADIAAASALPAPMVDRLRLDDRRLEAMACAVDHIADQPDPIGEIVEGRILPSGIRLEKRRTPIGTVLIIYESRPNVTTDAAALCLRAGNTVILRGGKETIGTNTAIIAAIHRALAPAGLADAVCFVDTPDREAVTALVGLRGIVDLCIPRGGPGLIDAVTSHARLPVIKHDAGNCHVYIDNHLDGLRDAAIAIVVNAKAQRPGVCNAAETLLVHRAIAPDILPDLGAALRGAGVALRADPDALALLPGAAPATEDDWRTEYLDLILAVRTVDSVDDAAAHIRAYGSGHTEAIVTSSIAAAERFTRLVDSASVMVNCSTRFADGGEYGLGAEIGISTDRLHARGPMGARDLTTFQWIARGQGHVRR
jgi:glutamate-5-semialdehyde dehydrogenase